jgi:hypothetical protein
MMTIWLASGGTRSLDQACKEHFTFGFVLVKWLVELLTVTVSCAVHLGMLEICRTEKAKDRKGECSRADFPLRKVSSQYEVRRISTIRFTTT